LIAALCFWVALTQGPVTIDRILAVVSGQPIVLSDVNAALEFHLVEPPPGTSDVVGAVLEQLIRRRLMLAEVDRFQPPEPDPVEIAARLDAMTARMGAAGFDRALSVTGLTRDQLRRSVRDDLRITTYLNQRFGANQDPAERGADIEKWVGDLRRRTEITVLARTP
jgi:hypothetical protein